MISLVRGLLFLLGGTSVASLLAWVYGVGSFSFWFRAVTVPGQLVLILVGLWVSRRAGVADLRRLLVAGVIGGLVGTLAYDLVRVPFSLAGFRVLAPIDSYGVLALGASESSPLTGIVGWCFHVANGIGFGVAYAAIAARRHWLWGVGWGLLLETATIVTPFATLYALRSDAGFAWTPIAIAYGAHLPYGAIVGRFAQHPERITTTMATLGKRSVPATLVATCGAIVLWQAPWGSALAREGAALADGASAVVVDGAFEPEWLRVAPGQCLTLGNRDDESWTLDVDGATPAGNLNAETAGASQATGAGVVLPAGEVTRDACFEVPGVHRVRTSDRPYSGGFVIVDDR